MPVILGEVQAQNVAFVIIAVVMAVAAVGVVTMRNIVHAALALVVVLAGVAAQYILLQAEFLGNILLPQHRPCRRLKAENVSLAAESVGLVAIDSGRATCPTVVISRV